MPVRIWLGWCTKSTSACASDFLTLQDSWRSFWCILYRTLQKALGIGWKKNLIICIGGNVYTIKFESTITIFFSQIKQIHFLGGTSSYILEFKKVRDNAFCAIQSQCILTRSGTHKNVGPTTCEYTLSMHCTKCIVSSKTLLNFVAQNRQYKDHLMLTILDYNRKPRSWGVLRACPLSMGKHRIALLLHHRFNVPRRNPFRENNGIRWGIPLHLKTKDT